MLTDKEIEDLKARAREGWESNGTVKCSTSEIGSLLNEITESRARKDPEPILTKAEIETVARLQEAARLVYYNNSYDNADRALFIDTIKQAQLIIYAAAVKRMKPGVSYQLIENPKEEPAPEQDAAARPMSIAEMKARNEAKVDPLGRGEKPSCPSIPSQSDPGSTTPMSQSVNDSPAKKPPLEGSEISQSSE